MSKVTFFNLFEKVWGKIILIPNHYRLSLRWWSLIFRVVTFHRFFQAHKMIQNCKKYQNLINNDKKIGGIPFHSDVLRKWPTKVGQVRNTGSVPKSQNVYGVSNLISDLASHGQWPWPMAMANGQWPHRLAGLAMPAQQGWPGRAGLATPARQERECPRNFVKMITRS